MKISIYLNKRHPLFPVMQRALSRQLSALETVKFKKEVEPAKPGTLGIPGEVVAFVCHHYKELSLLGYALVKVLSFIYKAREGGKKSGASAAPVYVLVIGALTLKFPNSAAAQKKFLREVNKLGAKGE